MEMDVELTSNAPVDGSEDPQPATGGQLRALFERSVKRGPDAMVGGSALKPREVTFLLDGSVGELREDGSPVFSDEAGNIVDIPVTLQSLTPEKELNALRNQTDPASIPFALAKAQLARVGGEPLDTAMREWFWRAIGSGGRQICVIAAQHVGGAGQTVMGKYQKSLAVL